MIRHILIKFLKDRFLLIMFYLINMICVITFFHLSEPANTEIFYPLSIGLFLLSVYLVIDWLNYYQTNKAIELMLRGQFTELQPNTEEQKAFYQLLKKNISEHTRKYNTMKEQKNESLYFLSHWMHFLKTPVSVIELIISKEKTEEATVLFEKIQRENKRIHTSIEQALTMVRMESFENDMDIIAVDLLTTLRKVINDRKRECIYHSIFPIIEFDGVEAFIVTDVKWNEILLDQIISNAIKYSSLKSGKKQLIFKIEHLGEYITLSVIDEGIGMPSYDIDRVFQAFFTGENGRKTPNSTGIGLYISKKIADKLGQTITLQSEVLRGTTVMIRWQAAENHLSQVQNVELNLTNT